MKLSRYASQKDNPAVKGDLTAEEIVRADWERNFKKSGVSFEQAKGGIKAHVDAGMPLDTALSVAGWTQAEIDEMNELKDASDSKAQAGLAGALMKAEQAMKPQPMPPGLNPPQTPQVMNG